MSPKNKKREPQFKRPDHVDFKTTEELKKMKLTGVRKNDMVLEYEFWILGEIVHRVSFLALAHDPQALHKAHMEVFKF